MGALKDMADKGKQMGKKAVDQGKQIGKKAVDKVDMTCDNCGKIMKPGGSVKKTIVGTNYQFCCDACATAYKPGSKAK